MVTNVFKDYCSGTVINTINWTVVDTHSRFSQSNAINIANPHGQALSLFSDTMKSTKSLASGIVVAQSNLTWTTSSDSEAFGGLCLYVDDSNYASIVSRSSAVSGGNYRLRVVTSGSVSYNNDDSGISKGKDVKIVYDVANTTIKFYYWDGSAWVQMGTTQTFSLGTPLIIALASQDDPGFNGANPITFDNLFLTKGDYSTQYPTADDGDSFFLFKY